MNPLKDAAELRRKVDEWLRTNGNTKDKPWETFGVSKQHFYDIIKRVREGEITGISDGYDYFVTQGGRLSSGCYHGNSEMMTEEQKQMGDPMYFWINEERE